MPRQRTGCVIKRKDRDGWWARLSYTDKSGERRTLQRKADNRTEAKQLLKKMLREVEDHGPEIVEADKMRFAALAKIYEQRKLIPPKYESDTKVAGLRSYKSQQRRLKTLVEHFGKKLIRSISHSDLEQFKNDRLALPTWRGDKRSYADVNRDLQTMRIVLNFAKQQGWLPMTPFQRGEPLINTAHERKRDRVLSREEEARLLAACERPTRLHLKSIIIALVDTALRRGELRGIVWSDVDLDAGVVRVRATIAKTAKPRTVPITARLRRELERLKVEAPDDLDRQVFGVFGDFKRAFAMACQEAEIEGLRIHDLRHSATTRMIEAGLPPAQVMVVTGHSEFATFRRYVSADDDAVRRAGEALDKFHADIGR
ncbi:MAG TPA: site-specific integrase, partial [Blastocatellia bacterium]|nr:site-specific integrase [Blastocatellia bacterium]